VDVSDEVVKDVPVPRDVPPDEAVYQLIVAYGFEDDAPNTTVPVPHRVPGVVLVIVGGVQAAISEEVFVLPDDSEITGS